MSMGARMRCVFARAGGGRGATVWLRCGEADELCECDARVRMSGGPLPCYKYVFVNWKSSSSAEVDWQPRSPATRTTRLDGFLSLPVTACTRLLHPPTVFNALVLPSQYLDTTLLTTFRFTSSALQHLPVHLLRQVHGVWSIPPVWLHAASDQVVQGEREVPATDIWISIHASRLLR